MSGQPKRDWHDYVRSGWVIVGAVSMIFTVAYQAGRLVESVSRPPVAVTIPDALRAELSACRVLAEVVDPRRRREK